MEIIRHKTQKIIVMAMLAIMIMCIATPVFAAGKLTLKSNMTVTKLNVEQKLTATSNTTGKDVYWSTENNKNVITIINGGTDRLGRTFVRFKANKEGSADLVAKDALTNGKELARCKVTVKLSDSEKKDDVNLNLDFEMPDLNIDTSGLADAAGTIGEGLISGIGKIGESGILENLFKMITDLITGIINSLKNINLELPSIGNTNIFKPEEKVLKIEIEKTSMEVEDTTDIKATVDGKEVDVEFRHKNYDENGNFIVDSVIKIEGNKVIAKKPGKAVILTNYKYKNGVINEELIAQVEVKVKEKQQQQQQNPPKEDAETQGDTNSGSGGIQRTSTKTSNSTWETYCTRMEAYLGYVEAASNATGVPRNTIMAVIYVESKANKNCVGADGEIGLMQIMPWYSSGYTTLPELTEEQLKDPETNIDRGTRLLKSHIDYYGNETDALQAYNMGRNGYAKNPNARSYSNSVKKARNTINTLYTFN